MSGSEMRIPSGIAVEEECQDPSSQPTPQFLSAHRQKKSSSAASLDILDEAARGLRAALKSLETTAQPVSFWSDIVECGDSDSHLISSSHEAPWLVDAMLSNAVKDREIALAMELVSASLEKIESLLGVVRPGSDAGDGGSKGASGVYHYTNRAESTVIGPRVEFQNADNTHLNSFLSAVNTKASSNASSGLLVETPTRQSAVLSHRQSFMAQSARGGAPFPINAAFVHVADGDVALWLNENFAQGHRRETNGMELQLVKEGSDGHSHEMENTPRQLRDMDDPSDVFVHPKIETPQPTIDTNKNATSPQSQGSPKPLKADDQTIADLVHRKSSMNVSACVKMKYTRSTTRSFPAMCSARRYAEMLESCQCPILHDIDSPEFNIFDIHAVYGSNLLVVVALNIFLQYNFIRSLQLDVARLVVFLETLRLFYRDENPYHNAIHAADVLQTTHVYLCVNDVKENFSDVELFALLFGAVTHDVGHVGISNAFLTKIRHPLARLYNDSSPLENCHASLAFSLLERPECNFFTGSHAFTRRLYDDFRNLVVEVLLGTDMRHHADQTKSVEGILEDGIIEDHEVGKLLKAILHAADLSNPMKPLPIYLKWVERVMAEFWQQGDEEKRRGMPISILCDRNGTNLPKSQIGFINFVVKPFTKELAPVLPSVWLERLDENVKALERFSKEEELALTTGVIRFAAQQWVDVDQDTMPSVVQVLREDVCTTVSDETAIPPSQFCLHNPSTTPVTTPENPAIISPFEHELGPASVPGSTLSAIVGGVTFQDDVSRRDRTPSTSYGGSSRRQSKVTYHMHDVDGESTSMHLRLLKKLTDAYQAEVAAVGSSSNDAHEGKVLPSSSSGKGTRQPLPAIQGKGRSPQDVSSTAHQRWLRLLLEVERDRTVYRKKVIERCRKGEKRPSTLFGKLNDDIRDALEFSIFRKSKTAREMLVRVIVPNWEEPQVTQIAAVDGGSHSHGTDDGSENEKSASLLSMPNSNVASTVSLSTVVFAQQSYDALLAKVDKDSLYASSILRAIADSGATVSPPPLAGLVDVATDKRRQSVTVEIPAVTTPATELNHELTTEERVSTFAQIGGVVCSMTASLLRLHHTSSSFSVPRSTDAASLVASSAANTSEIATRTVGQSGATLLPPVRSLRGGVTPPPRIPSPTNSDQTERSHSSMENPMTNMWSQPTGKLGELYALRTRSSADPTPTWMKAFLHPLAAKPESKSDRD